MGDMKCWFGVKDIDEKTEACCEWLPEHGLRNPPEETCGNCRWSFYKLIPAEEDSKDE